MMHSAPSEERELTAWIGRSETVEDVASRSSAVGLAAVLDRPIASSSSDRTGLFPLGYWLHFTPTAPMSELGVDGHPKLGDFMPPLDLPRRMWAGSKVSFHSPITVGQHLQRTTTIESISPKKGTSGRLCFVVLRHEITADRTLAVVEHQTIVYREAVELDPQGPSPQRPPRTDTAPPDDWEWHRALRPDEATLFRYSALTFNTHRIHYDLPYATRAEGYPGLVVHGPLSATYIMDSFLAQHPDATVTRFEFSARSPVFANEQIHVVGKTEPDGLEKLAVIAPGGDTAIAALIEYR